MGNIKACIMAGGVGSRFWPASTEERPKQFLDILGLNRSLLQLTFDRYRKIGLEATDIFVVTNEQYVDLVMEHLPEMPREHVIGEPARKNTAPAAYLGNKVIEHLAGESIVIMAPSDHHIEDDDAFARVIQIGTDFLADHDALITIGIQPTFPHTGYGYINFQKGAQMPFEVKAFVEKPNVEKATEFLNAGGYLWNAGIFMWRTSTLNNAFVEHSPEIKKVIDQYVTFDGRALNRPSLQLSFEHVLDASIDYEIMERASNVFTIPASMMWSDLGSWKSLYDKSSKVKDENVDLSSQSLILDASSNLIFAPGKKVVIKGLSNYMVIEENDTLVICPMDDDQEVKVWRNEMMKDKSK